MSSLTCDICGGTLEMDSTGEFGLCESCGMKHSKARIKTKVQEIKGVVEVTKGDAEKERLLKNAKTFLELKEIEKARKVYLQISNDYPDEYRGWEGLYFISLVELNERYQVVSASISFLNGALICGYLSCLEDINKNKSKIKYICSQEFYDSYKDDILINEKFLREISANDFSLKVFKDYVLGHYQEVNFAGEQMMSAVEPWVEEYIDLFLKGETTEMYKVSDGYMPRTEWPQITKMYDQGYKNAKRFNELDETEQDMLIAELGMKFGYREKVEFLLGKKQVNWGPDCPSFVEIKRPILDVDDVLQELLIAREQKENYMKRGVCAHCGGNFQSRWFIKSCLVCGKVKDY